VFGKSAPGRASAAGASSPAADARSVTRRMLPPTRRAPA